MPMIFKYSFGKEERLPFVVVQCLAMLFPASKRILLAEHSVSVDVNGVADVECNRP